MRALLLTALLPLAATAAPPPKIAWWPTLEQARAEAARTGKPIFLLSAAPHCGQVPGMW